MALAVVLAGFLNSTEFSKVFAGDVSLNGLFNMAIAEGEECWQYDGAYSYIAGTEYHDGQTGWAEYSYAYSRIEHTGHGCWCMFMDFGVSCEETWENADCDWLGWYDIDCGGTYVA